MKRTKQIKVGNVLIGGGAPVTIQSMTNTLTTDVDKTIDQIRRLEEAGCEIIRVSVPDKESLNALGKIKHEIKIPLVADIHYDPKLAIGASNIADKIRINPGNIGSIDDVRSIVYSAKNNGIPIRIGVNLGSIEKEFEKQFGLSAKAMVESAIKHVKLLESLDFYDIVLSLKASDVPKTMQAYKMISQATDYPLHIGITEAGTDFAGTIKSSVGIGALLAAKIGDTIRVSLSADPVKEIQVAKEILKSLGMLNFGVSVTACPTCARANFDVSSIAKEIEEKTFAVKDPMRIAIMGCGVNGPGEAKEADIGVVGGKDKCLFYKNGAISDRIDKEDIIGKVLNEIKK
ncbi:MAG: flavodoxin-dependent (E)-4-hydroxy-3-methylbut-2-enyl-diphosphate synthase [Nanoarchaeota archaeon]